MDNGYRIPDTEGSFVSLVSLFHSSTTTTTTTSISTSMTMPHDGYHYTLDYLKSFANSDDAIYRRGAPDTFDPASLYRDMERIRNNTNEEEDLIKVPGFDHANGDPEPDQHIFDRNHHDVVICEGLYLLHDQDGWENIKSLLDFSIFMESDVDICVERVKIRNQCIPGYSREEIVERAEKVDRINAMTVLHSKYRADVVVESTATKKQTQ
jgi:pantothenate kinase